MAHAINDNLLNVERPSKGGGRPRHVSIHTKLTFSGRTSLICCSYQTVIDLTHEDEEHKNDEAHENDEVHENDIDTVDQMLRLQESNTTKPSIPTIDLTGSNTDAWRTGSSIETIVNSLKTAINALCAVSASQEASDAFHNALDALSLQHIQPGPPIESNTQQQSGNASPRPNPSSIESNAQEEPGNPGPHPSPSRIESNAQQGPRDAGPHPGNASPRPSPSSTDSNAPQGPKDAGPGPRLCRTKSTRSYKKKSSRQSAQVNRDPEGWGSGDRLRSQEKESSTSEGGVKRARTACDDCRRKKRRCTHSKSL